MALAFMFRDARIHVNEKRQRLIEPEKDSGGSGTLLRPDYRSANKRGRELANIPNERTHHAVYFNVSMFSSFLFGLIGNGWSVVKSLLHGKKNQTDEVAAEWHGQASRS